MEYGLIGYPLKHSFSKEIHEAIKDYYHDNDYNYDLCELEENDLSIFIKNKDFRAINVTIPYKEKLIPYIDYIDDSANKIGAINTIVNKNNKLYAYNTDYYGLKALISKNNIDVASKDALILGTGGTSKTAYQVLKDLNANNIYKASRKKTDNVYTYDEIYDKFKDIEVIVNTTPVGMYPNNEDVIIDVKRFKNLKYLIDVIYNPINTSLVLNARKDNVKAYNALYMLVAQAVYAYHFFKGKAIIEEDIIKCIDVIYEKIVKSKLNIALIGMPTSGKTTVGKYLSELLGKNFVDSDSLIEKEIKMPIKDYIIKFGEASFRKIEAEVIKEISKKQNQVIATGGGCILNEANVYFLKQNSRIYFLNRSLDKLQSLSDRPLSSSYEDLKKRYDERINLYLSYNDKEINANMSIEEVANAIMEDFNG